MRMRQMLACHAAGARSVKLVVRTEAGCGADHRRARHSAAEEKLQNRGVKEIVRGTGVLIQVDDHLFRRSR